MKSYKTTFVIGILDDDKMNSITEYSVLVSKNNFLVFTREVDMLRTNLKYFQDAYNDKIAKSTIGDYFTVCIDEGKNNKARFEYSRLYDRYVMQNGRRSSNNESDLTLAEITYNFLAQKYGKDAIHAVNPKLLTRDNYSKILSTIIGENINNIKNTRIGLKTKRIQKTINSSQYDPWQLNIK